VVGQFSCCLLFSGLTLYLFIDYIIGEASAEHVFFAFSDFAYVTSVTGLKLVILISITTRYVFRLKKSILSAETKFETVASAFSDLSGKVFSEWVKHRMSAGWSQSEMQRLDSRLFKAGTAYVVFTLQNFFLELIALFILFGIWSIEFFLRMLTFHGKGSFTPSGTQPVP
jgi:hypothetical protein